MRFSIRLLPEAKTEFDAAADRYEAKQIGLGADFVVRVREVLNRIADNPKLHRVVYQDVRKAVVTRFPYIMLYHEEPGEVVVISVFHTSRDPAEWQSRI